MSTQSLLDQLDPARHDVEALLVRLNAWDELEDDHSDKAEGFWIGTGLDQAEHPLTAFTGESHNTVCVVRDLDADLKFVFETSSASGEWKAGPLYRDHIDDEELAHAAETGNLGELGIALTAAELAAIIEQLPTAPGPVRSF
jgi:hypothetical protein